MVVEVSEQEAAAAGAGAGIVAGTSAGTAKPRDRWNDAYNNQPVRRMVALYDYDPQELSPNVDADAELSFQTGQIIHVYGDMDDDGFYMAEIDGVRGLVPSNFLTEATDQYPGTGQQGNQGVSGAQRTSAGRGRGQGPGARGPPPPPRDNVAPAPRMQNRKPDACPLPPSQLDHNTCASNPEQANAQARARGAAVSAAASTIARTTAGNAGTPPVQSPAAAANIVGIGAGALATSAAGVPAPMPAPAPIVASPARRPGPALVPAPSAQPLQSAQPPTSQPNLMQKFSEMTAPGGDILSKGKELIFMKFGLGGK
ncbi:RIMS-binding protein 2 [Eumeta japonica]|uniref:RIMS-binding protein 2 n=1 Tax=Eumeta variegata TaxID=151549 RepID=A0A4C1SER3_EUMVA|nr:RIMS-binding protein 2 [Eumeta japonica]